MLKTVSPLLIALAVLCAGPVRAELAEIRNESAFREAVVGKVLTLPLVRLQVRSDGTIVGTGAARRVVGNWDWRDGYFCRVLKWGSRDLGHNCQQVGFVGEKLRFTSDRGAGDFADFRVADQ